MCFSLCPFVAGPLPAAHRTFPVGFTPPSFRCKEFEELAAQWAFGGTAFPPTGLLDRSCFRVARHPPAICGRRNYSSLHKSALEHSGETSTPYTTLI